jgi:hypothetical protein
MKYREMKETFKEELSFLSMITEYESGLEQIHNMMEAATNIEGWQNDGYDDFPKSFNRIDGPSILMALWNTFIVPDEETQKAINAEEWEEQTKAEHPDWLAFDSYYPDGSCLFINPDSISDMLLRHNYDEAHRELVAKALMAYHKNYQDNL